MYIERNVMCILVLIVYIDRCGSRICVRGGVAKRDFGDIAQQSRVSSKNLGLGVEGRGGACLQPPPPPRSALDGIYIYIYTYIYEKRYSLGMVSISVLA